MAMTPQEKTEFENLKRVVARLQQMEDLVFRENIKRRAVDPTITVALAAVDLEDLRNVTITSPTNGQVLKYNGTAWVNGTDLT
jgi:methyl coenzyme M reductase subunit C